MTHDEQLRNVGLSSASSLRYRSVWRVTLLRTIVPALLIPALYMAMVFLVALPAFERNMRLTRQESARSQVESAVTLLASYGAQVDAGTLALEEAKARAMERLRGIRYGNGGREYFWINDLQPVILMHPYMHEIEGSGIFDIPDREGRPLLLAFLEIVESPEQGGFCYYRWQDREKPTEPQDKVSYVKLYEPWGWVVGTGVYTADVEVRVAEMTRTMIMASLVILAAILAISVFAVLTSVRRERLRIKAERAVHDREQTLRAVFDNMVQFIGLVSCEGNLILCNQTSLKVIDMGEVDVLGQPFWDTPWWSHSPVLQVQLREALAQCRDQARTVRFAAKHTTSDGQILDVDFSLSPIIDDQGQVIRMVAEGRDMTAINRATAAVQKREADLATILNSIHDGVIALDLDGRVRRVNAVAARLLLVSEQEAVGKPLLEVLPLTRQEGRPFDDLLSILLAPTKAGQPVSAECLDIEGVPLAVEVLGAVVRAESGERRGSVIVLRDCTEEIQLRKQLFQSQKLEAIGRLAGGVAHDFNNLLTAILGNAQLLCDENGDRSAVASPAREIVEASTRAADLTGQLLAFSRKGKVTSLPVDVHEVLSKVTALLDRSIDKRIEVRSELNADLSVVAGDASQLYNALLNLGLNSRDAMPEGGALTVTTDNLRLGDGDLRLAGVDLEPGEYIVLTVADTGTGMSEEVIRHIFEPFYTTKPVGEGTGLGLAGVYGCVADHRGSIEVQSEPGVGTAFTISLPISNERAAVAPTTGDEVVSGRGRVLVVDDEEPIREFAARALEKYGYEVVTCADGLEAEASMTDNVGAIDLVLLDLVMPKISGEETFRRLRAIDPTVPVVIASGYSRDQAVTDMIHRGAAGFLGKPYRLGELTQMMQEHVRSRS